MAFPGNPDNWIVVLIIIFEIVLLTFVYFISRFYELKFKEKTYYLSFLVPAGLFVMLFLIWAITGIISLDVVSLITNLSILIIISTFGFMLYSRMMGVSR